MFSLGSGMWTESQGFTCLHENWPSEGYLETTESQAED